jgi:hypothetical protein
MKTGFLIILFLIILFILYSYCQSESFDQFMDVYASEYVDNWESNPTNFQAGMPIKSYPLESRNQQSSYIV